jgi:hypothetical protein
MISMKPFASVLQVLLGVILALAVPLGVLFRIMQLLYAIDYSTGFYKEWHFSLPMLDVTLAVTAVLVLLSAVFLRKMELSVPHMKTLGVSLFSFLCAAGIALQLVLQMVQAKEWGVLFFLSFLLSAVSVGCFVALGIKTRQHMASSPAFLFRNIVLTLWCCVEILMVFFDHSTESNTSEYVFIILFLYFATLFFVKYGKLAFYSGPTNACSFSLLVSSSLMGLFGCILSIPNFFVALSGAGSWLELSPFSCVALPLGAYGLVFFYSNCFHSVFKKGLRV